MKLIFIALIFLLSTVAGNQPSPARRVDHGAQRSIVVKHNVGHSSGDTRSLNKHHPKTGKSSNSNSGIVGKTQQKKSVKNAVQPTRSPNLNSSAGRSGNSNSGEDRKTQQQQNVIQTTRSPNSKNSIEKSKNSNSSKDGKTQQQQNAVQPTHSLNLKFSAGKSGNSNNGKDIKPEQQQKDTVQRFPKLDPSTEKADNSNSGKDRKTQQEKNVIQPTRSPNNSKNSVGKSRNLNSGKDRKTQQQQKDTVQRTPKLDLYAEKVDNSNSDQNGKTQQLQNAPQKTPTLKPTTAEKSSNSSSAKVGETLLQQHNYNSKTEAHYHYHYSPPQQISYGSTYHPVYQGHPPVYVYEYRDSGSRFDNLLTGLALYNLGRNSHSHHYSSERQYSGTPGEICKLGISKRTGEYEETRIDCNLMSSFIWEDTTSTTRNEQHVVKNTTEVKVTQAVNGTGNPSVTTVSVTSNTVEDALKVKGPSIAVTPGMACFMIRTFRDNTALRKPVDCGLLQEYARSSLFHNSAQRHQMPLMVLNLLLILISLRI